MEVSNSQINFGMALRKPSNKEMEGFVNAVGLNRKGLAGSLRKRGLNQLEKELRQCDQFDVRYAKVDGKHTFQVLNTADGVVKKSFNAQSDNLIQDRAVKAIHELDEYKYDGTIKGFLKGIKIWSKTLAEGAKVVLLNPKNLMPKALLTAAQESQNMERAYKLELKAQEEAAKRQQKAVDAVNKIFDK